MGFNIQYINGFWYQVFEEDTYRESLIILSPKLQEILNKEFL